LIHREAAWQHYSDHRVAMVALQGHTTPRLRPMKLATLRNGRPDGQLVVLSADLARYVSAGRIAPTLQAALDDWDALAPALAALATHLEAGAIAGQDFDADLALAPLPRAYQGIERAG